MPSLFWGICFEFCFVGAIFLILAAHGGLSHASALPDLAQDQGVWPCPEFGGCQTKLFIGPCQGVLFFEWSKEQQVLESHGQSSFWRSDPPRPCALTLHVGQEVYRRTLEVWDCREIKQRWETWAHRLPPLTVTPSSGVSMGVDGDGYGCTDFRPGVSGGDSSGSGLLVAVHPHGVHRDGLWRSAVRERYEIPGLKPCRLQEQSGDSGSWVCPGLDPVDRDLLEGMTARLGWRVLQKSPRLIQSVRPKLAPGDRWRGDED